MFHLDRIWPILPLKGATEGGMTLEKLVPGLPKNAAVKGRAKNGHHLLDIYS